jgi:hypothetical protein
VSAASAPVLIAGRYELNELLAAGGFGEVWQATDLSLRRPVAVKILHASFAGHPETMARFRAEARHSGSLSHENVARVYDYGEPPDAQAPYLVMELVPGPSLAGLLADGPLDPVRVTDIIAQAAAGLDAAHRAGLVHRDIKPGNLLIRPDGRVKITDFGISYAAGAAPVTRTGQLVGTPGYLAPERVRGGRASAASDLYSLGVVAWECLVGSVPFEGAPVEVAIAHRDRPLPPLPASVPAELAALVRDLTAKDPEHRPATAGAVAGWAAGLRDRLASGAVLRPAGPVTGSGVAPVNTAELAGLAGRARPHRRAAGLSRARRSGPFWAAAAAAAVIAAAAGLALAGMLGPDSPHRSAALAAGGGTPSAAAAAIEVSGKSLIGQPVSTVITRLRKLGLKVVVRWEVSASQQPGHVVSVQPAGLLPPGSVVTVTGALQPGTQAPPGYARPAAPGTFLPAPTPVPASSSPRASTSASSSPSGSPSPSGSGSSSPSPSGSPSPTGSPSPSGSPTSSPSPSGSPTLSPSSPAPSGSSPAPSGSVSASASAAVLALR